MNHRAGIVISAVVALLGSLLLLAMAGLMLALPYFVPEKAGPFPPQARAGMYVLAALFLLGAAWGISTSIGLFRRDRWARISILIFSFMMGATFLVSLLVVLVIPLPQTPGGPPPGSVRLLLAVFYGLLTAMAAAWAVYFTRSGVKTQFGTPLVRTDPRPLSIVIIGWWLALASVFVIPSALLRIPAFLLGMVFTGWSAAVLYLLFAGLSFYAGRGLLRLDPHAHKVAVAYLAFGAVNGASIFFLPDRFAAVMHSMPAWMQPPPGAPQIPLNHQFLIGPIIGIMGVAIPLWFLIARRSAFSKPVA